jgi:hypothetical protein
MSAAKVGAALSDGTRVTTECEAEGEPVSNGYQTIAIWDRLSDGTWLPNAFLDTGSETWTPGVPRCGEVDEPIALTPDPRRTSQGNPCIQAYPGGAMVSSDTFGGHRTDSDRVMSLYLVCSGFGAPEGLEFSAAMKWD